MLDSIARHWWIPLFRGILSIALGAFALAAPFAAGLALALLFGAYALVDGIVAIAAALRTRGGAHWGWLLAEGIFGAIFGLFALAFPVATLLVLTYFVSAWAIVTGIASITTAWHVRREITGEWLWIALGVISVLFGILVLFEPVTGVLAIAYTFSFYAILSGFMFMGLAFRLRSLSPRNA
jgi:uncharacterized membrane protein HdeD (DUF308 family)